MTQMNTGWVFKDVFLHSVYSVGNIPCRPLLSKKLLRLNSVFLEARYCINLCNERKTTYEELGMLAQGATSEATHQLTVVQWTTLLVGMYHLVHYYKIITGSLIPHANILYVVHVLARNIYQICYLTKTLYISIQFSKGGEQLLFKASPHCRRPSDGVWWWGIWRQPPSWCWWSSQTVCQPTEGCSHSSHLCTESSLREEKEREGRKRGVMDLWANVVLRQSMHSTSEESHTGLLFSESRDVLHRASSFTSICSFS